MAINMLLHKYGGIFLHLGTIFRIIPYFGFVVGLKLFNLL